LPVFLVDTTASEPSERMRELAESLDVAPDTISPDQIPEGLPEDGGWLLLPPQVSPEMLGRLLLSLAEAPGAWSVLVVQDDGDEARLVPFSPGYPEGSSRAAERLREGGLDEAYLGHRHVLLDLAQLRHDANNVLTSALAEAQFMRMDADEGTELHEGLTLIERQLKRLRDLVGELATLRVSST
jgi:hypothetical protein